MAIGLGKVAILRIPAVMASRSTVSTAQRLGYESQARLLIVNADDFGLCHEENLATIEGMKRGVISSASVMVPGRGFDEAAEFARGHPEADIGVHLALTSEWGRDNKWSPVSRPEAVRSLTDGQGAMWPSPAKLFSRANPEEAEAELRAQVDKALSAGIDVSHIDSHMFVLHGRHPAYRAIYLRIARDYCLPIRATRRALILPIALNSVLDDYALPFRAARRVFILRTGFASIFEEAERLGLLFPDNLVILGPTNPEAAEGHWAEVIRRLPPGLTEIYCHPAFATAELLDYVTDARHREADFHFFASEGARSLLRQQGVQLTGYKPLRTAMRAAMGSGAAVGQ